MKKKKSIWFVYMVSCSDNSLYTGITTDLSRRVGEHNSRKRGAKYTRGRQPVRLVYYEEYDSRSFASKRESSVRKLTPTQKRALIHKFPSPVTS